jgi:two-component system CheB/CheR fusion protein
MGLSPSHIVGIGGSEGGLKAYQALLQALAPDTGMAFAIISHMSPTSRSLLTEILANSTSMPVIEATDGLEARANCVYVIKPDTDLSVRGAIFKAVCPRTMKKGRHYQVDHFFESLAEEIGARAIGVILSGGDGDGSQGCKHIKAAGGITFAQDTSAKIDSMPESATDTGCVDFIMAPEAIGLALSRIAKEARGT